MLEGNELSFAAFFIISLILLFMRSELTTLVVWAFVWTIIQIGIIERKQGVGQPKIKGGNTESMIGLIGGIFGFVGALAALFISGLPSVVGISNISLLLAGSAIAMASAAMGIVGAIIVKNDSETGGTLMIVSAIFGLVGIFIAYIAAAVLLLIAGIMSIRKK